MRIIVIFFIMLSSYAYAQQPPPLFSCIHAKMDRIDKDTGNFVLKNVFSPQLFNQLMNTFTENDVDWTDWNTNVIEYKDQDGKDKTKLEGCFNITRIKDETELITSIMRVSIVRFQAAMEFYSKPGTKMIPQDNMDSMLDGYEGLLNDPAVKKLIEDKLEHNKQIHPTPNGGAAD